MKCYWPIRCVVRASRIIERATKAVPFSDFPIVEDLLKSFRVLPTFIFMTVSPRRFYARIERYASGKSALVPPPTTFALSLAALFVFGLFRSDLQNEVRFTLLLGVITAPIWIYVVVVFTYALIYLTRGLLYYAWKPFWTGPELAVMFSRPALVRLDKRLFFKAWSFLAPQCFVVIPLVLAFPFGILVLEQILNRRTDYAPVNFDIPFGIAFLLSAMILTWLVVRPASYLFLYCVKIPTTDVLKLTIFREVLAAFEETDNMRLASDSERSRVRTEWDIAITRLRIQEGRIAKYGPDALRDYLEARSGIMLEPLYRCLDTRADAPRLESINAIARGRRLSPRKKSADAV